MLTSTPRSKRGRTKKESMLDFPKAFIRRLTGASVVESAQLRILAFETARAMSSLLTLHRAINQTSISVLQNTIAQSPGVAYLNFSVDEKDRVVQIACAEMLDDLDQVAAVISRLSARCVFAWPREFSQVYAGLKSGCDGVFNQKLCVPAKVLEGRVRKMESYVASASNLYSEMGVLSEMEASERSLEKWIDYSGPIHAGEGKKEMPPGADKFLKNIDLQRKLVRKLQDQTLWCQNRDKVSELMADVAVAIFLRICVVFGNHVAQLPAVEIDRNGKFNMFRKSTATHHMTGPLLSSTPAVQNQEITKFSGPLRLGRRHPFPQSPIARPKIDLIKLTAKTLSPRPGSVGSAGLALRYADIIVLCEKIFQSPNYCTADERDELYRMLPKSFRNILREKLMKSDGGGGGGVCIGAIEKARRVLDWLAPMAHDTINHFSVSSYEKHRLDSSPKALMLQTLHNSDQKKTEAAIVDMLLGLCLLLKNI